MKIDSHHHFWKYSPAEYSWIDRDKVALQRDFLPHNLEPELKTSGIDGVLSVQARQTIEETKMLLGYAEQYDFIKGVVGWVSLTDQGVQDELSRLATNPKLKAVRHVVQDEPDNDFILRKDFNRGVGFLKKIGVAYDILIYEQHLPQTIKFVDRHPQQVFILDHIGKPCIRDRSFATWSKSIKNLAKRSNVNCKLSGMVTEADFASWTQEQLQPYFDVVLEAFGPSRLMFGSDWPVCLLGCSYNRWVQVVSRLIAQLTQEEQTKIFGQTACTVYNL